jgi:hypothetical protein
MGEISPTIEMHASVFFGNHAAGAIIPSCQQRDSSSHIVDADRAFTRGVRQAARSELERRAAAIAASWAEALPLRFVTIGGRSDQRLFRGQERHENQLRPLKSESIP